MGRFQKDTNDSLYVHMWTCVVRRFVLAHIVVGLLAASPWLQTKLKKLNINQLFLEQSVVFNREV